jgi:hypothetical protein
MKTKPNPLCDRCGCDPGDARWVAASPTASKARPELRLCKRCLDALRGFLANGKNIPKPTRKEPDRLALAGSSVTTGDPDLGWVPLASPPGPRPAAEDPEEDPAGCPLRREPLCPSAGAHPPERTEDVGAPGAGVGPRRMPGDRKGPPSRADGVPIRRLSE